MTLETFFEPDSVAVIRHMLSTKINIRMMTIA